LTEGEDGATYYKQVSKKIKPESHFEINYAYSLTSGVTITPFFQYVWDIYTGVAQYQDSSYAYNDGKTTLVNASVNDYGYAGGVRLTLNF
jgi:hypothetical protein